MESFITKDGKKLRRGYTTGSCAAAAAKSAALTLFSGVSPDTVHLVTPCGTELDLKVVDTVIGDGFVTCGIVKDAGDDPDVTDGITVYARVEKTGEPYCIGIDGGEGVGRVTKPGLDQPVGAAAINSTPRRMITEELRSVCEDNGYTGGLRVVVSAPAGVQIAKKTFNPRLGIEGGISILGTTGIVEPMSDAAVVETIRAELSLRAAAGKKSVLFTPGNYGAEYIKNDLGIDPEIAVTVSNFIGDAFALAADLGFESARGRYVQHSFEIRRLPRGDLRFSRRFVRRSRRCGQSRDERRRYRRYARDNRRRWASLCSNEKRYGKNRSSA